MTALLRARWPYHLSRYLVPILLSALALMPWLIPGDHMRPALLLLALGAVVVSAWYGGVGPGLLATLVGIVAALLFDHPSLNAAPATLTRYALQLALFLLIGAAVPYLGRALRRNQESETILDDRARNAVEFTDALTRNLSEGIVAIDRRGRITYANPAAEQLLGWTARELIDHGMDASTLLQRADIAMYIAKRDGDGYALYAREQDQHSISKLALISELRRSIGGNELMLHYQPKVNGKTGDIDGVESAEVLELLSSLGCDVAQGYYVGRPVDARELVASGRIGTRHDSIRLEREIRTRA